MAHHLAGHLLGEPQPFAATSSVPSRSGLLSPGSSPCIGRRLPGWGVWTAGCPVRRARLQLVPSRRRPERSRPTPYRPAGEPARHRGGTEHGRRRRRPAGRPRGLGRATSFEVVAGAWRGPASEAFLVDGAGSGRGWAAPPTSSNRPPAPCPSWPPAWSTPRRPGTGPSAWPPGRGRPGVAGRRRAAATRRSALVAGQAVRMAAAAEHEAAAARRVAAARLDHAAGAPGHGGDRHGGRGGWWGSCWRGPRWRPRPITWSRAPRRASRRRAGWPRRRRPGGPAAAGGSPSRRPRGRRWTA